MSCTHENVDVLGASLVKVTEHGAYVLFELHECQDCGHRFIIPYLELAEIDPIPADFNVVELEDEVEITPSEYYVRTVLGFSSHTSINPNETRRQTE